MPQIKPKLSTLLALLEEVPRDPGEGAEFDEIPGWDGETIEALTAKAALLKVHDEAMWFPLSQLRSATPEGVVLASNWILEQKLG